MFLKSIIEKIDGQDDKGNKTKNDNPMYPGAFLNFMTVMYLAYLARTISGFFAIEPPIKQAPKTNAEC